MQMTEKGYNEMMDMFNKYCRFVENPDPEGRSEIVEIVSYPSTDEEREHLEFMVDIYNHT